MNTAKLKTFAQQSRIILMEGVRQKLLYWGFDNKGNIENEPMAIQGGMVVNEQVVDDPTLPLKWRSLKHAISSKGIEQVIEEASYTWFNRMIAMRILSENGYDQPQLTYGDNTTNTPLILQRARRGLYEFLNNTNSSRLASIINNHDREIDAFAILLLGYCSSHKVISNVFGTADDFTEILLPNNVLAENGFVHLLNNTDAIKPEDYEQVELIGWLYQFYISDKKDEVFKGFKKNIKAEAKDIPAATQIFTPNWIVKYMVENTVGKLWLDLNPNSPLKSNMKYLVENAEGNPVSEPIIDEVAKLKLLDPACGSGHILVEGFDLQFQMYMEEFYSKEEAVISILQNNLFGLDIDKRAVQLSNFAILLKAAVHFPDVLNKSILPNVYAMPDPHQFSSDEVSLFLGDDGTQYHEKLYDALQLMQQAQNLGSIMLFDWPKGMDEYVLEKLQQLKNKGFRGFDEESLLVYIKPYIEVLSVLTQKYESVAANPPYMGQKNMNAQLKKYVGEKYPISKSDLFAVFIETMINLVEDKARMGCITMESWMFLSSYEKLRKKLLNNYSIGSLAHFGWHIIGIAFGTASMILEKSKNINIGEYSYLTINDVERDRNIPYIFPKKDNNRFSRIPQTNFSKIPGSPIAYWASSKIVSIFSNAETLQNIGLVRQGASTSNNDRFLKYWHEVSITKIGFNIESLQSANDTNFKWFPYNKGGAYRKWYGNFDTIINYENDGFELKKFQSTLNQGWTVRLKSRNYYFKSAVSWPKISSGSFSVRYYPQGFIFDVAGCCYFPDNEDLKEYIVGFLNSNVAKKFLEFISPTLNYEIEQIKRLPFINAFCDKIINVKEIYNLSKKDWDTLETSWDFENSPLLNEKNSLYHAFQSWQEQVTKDFFQLHSNEEKLNRIFIDIYGLQDELTPEVPLKDITILQEELDRNALEMMEPTFREQGKDAFELPIKKNVVMQQLISYAIGCMMGRYRLDKPGLHIAHYNPTEDEVCTYNYNDFTFEIDDDAIIPLMGKNCGFSDDALNRFNSFIDIVWGAENRTENMNFLQECLGKDIDVYMVNNYWKDHCKTYKKKPIYWLFASKKGAFQVLVYMHRMNRFTVEKIRTKYLLPHLRYLQNNIDLLKDKGASISREDARKLDKFRYDRDECEEYDMFLKDKAEKIMSDGIFDLDDGVTENYKLFEGVVAKIK